MTSGKLLRQLFRGYANGNDAAFLDAADALVDNERSKNHRLLADDLEQILLSRPKGNQNAIAKRHDIPVDRESGFPLLEVQESRDDWEKLILPSKTTQKLQQIAREHARRDVLLGAGLTPKQRVLFYGPPGCGKTLAAQVMAGVLYRPLVTVRFDAVVSSFLGETAANLRKVFEFIERGSWVVLFDEFDAIGKDRDNAFEHGELKRVVNSLLQLMDAFRGESLLIAATNYESLLDRALWRRFEAVVPFTLPSPQDRILMVRMFLKSFDSSQIDLKQLGKKLHRATGADIEWFCKELARNAVLDHRNHLSPQDVSAVMVDFKERISLFYAANTPTTEQL